MLSATPMSPAAFYEAFLAVLQVYGYVAVPAGKVIKIVPNTDARQLPANRFAQRCEFDLGRNRHSDHRAQKHQRLAARAGAAPLDSPIRASRGVPGGNMLIIADRASNVSRIVRIVERMDESGDEPYDLVELHNASASELVRVVNQLNQGAAAGGEAGAGVKVVADERTNSVLISGEKSLRLKIKALIISLDTPKKGGAGDTEVRYLRYADAEKLAEKLKGQATATAKAQGGPGATSGAAQASVGGGGGQSNLDASVTLWADVPTNALVITAPPKIMKSLMAVIDKLDIRRAQVEVEAIIVEIDVNKSSNLGVQWITEGNNTRRRHRQSAGIRHEHRRSGGRRGRLQSGRRQRSHRHDDGPSVRPPRRSAVRRSAPERPLRSAATTRIPASISPRSSRRCAATAAATSFRPRRSLR